MSNTAPAAAQHDNIANPTTDNDRKLAASSDLFTRAELHNILDAAKKRKLEGLAAVGEKNDAWKDTCTLEELQEVLQSRFNRAIIPFPEGCYGHHQPSLDTKGVPYGTVIICTTCQERCCWCHEPIYATTSCMGDFDGLYCERCYRADDETGVYKCKGEDACKRSDLHEDDDT